MFSSILKQLKFKMNESFLDKIMMVLSNFNTVGQKMGISLFFHRIDNKIILSRSTS